MNAFIFLVNAERTKKIEQQEEIFSNMKKLHNMKCLINPESKFYQWWNIVNSLVIIYIAIFVPYKFSFIENPNEYWDLFDSLIDFFFAVDIVITFFIPYYEGSKFIISHWKIAKTYVFSIWFWVDVVSIVPFDKFLNQNNDYSVLIRILKLPKFYKMVKIVLLISLLFYG